MAVEESRLRPTTKWQETRVVLSLYAGVVIVSSVFGLEAIMFGVLMFVFAASLAFLGVRRPRALRAAALTRDVQVALNTDDAHEAARLAHRLLHISHRNSLPHAAAVMTWGTVQLRLGNPARAIELYRRVHATRRFSGRVSRVLGGWRLLSSQALAHAVDGDVDAARKMLAQAETETPDNHRPESLMLRAYIDCRGGQMDSAVRLFDAEWRTAEPLLTIGSARAARMLEAFALQHVEGDGYRSGVSERLRRALDRAAEAPRGAFDYLAVKWPELRDFIVLHSLDAVAPDESSSRGGKAEALR